MIYSEKSSSTRLYLKCLNRVSGFVIFISNTLLLSPISKDTLFFFFLKDTRVDHRHVKTPTEENQSKKTQMFYDCFTKNLRNPLCIYNRIHTNDEICVLTRT